jgi:hypothetical protein
VSATFIYLLVFLKLPILGLLYIVWWAVKSPPEPEPAGDQDGGSKTPVNPSPRHPHHPRPALPRNRRGPRRGPHAAPPVPAPARMRTVIARARRVEH